MVINFFHWHYDKYYALYIYSNQFYWTCTNYVVRGLDPVVNVVISSALAALISNYPNQWRFRFSFNCSKNDSIVQINSIYKRIAL